jgi:hypothetical protein
MITSSPKNIFWTRIRNNMNGNIGNKKRDPPENGTSEEDSNTEGIRPVSNKMYEQVPHEE